MYWLWIYARSEDSGLTWDRCDGEIDEPMPGEPNPRMSLSEPMSIVDPRDGNHLSSRYLGWDIIYI